MSTSFYDGLGALHARLLGGASNDVAEAMAATVLARLVNYTESTNPQSDVQAIVDAVHDAIIAYLRRPEAARALTGRDAYTHLQLAAWRNLRNIERSDRRRARREALFALDLSARARASEQRVVELCGAAGKVSESDQASSKAKASQSVTRLMLSGKDQVIANMIAAGVRRTSDFAVAVGVLGLGIAEQRRAVKRAKDRIKAILKRGGCSVVVP